MREIINAMIEKLEYFGLEEDAKNYREDAENELRFHDTVENQALWAMVRSMAELLENYTA